MRPCQCVDVVWSDQNQLLPAPSSSTETKSAWRFTEMAANFRFYIYVTLAATTELRCHPPTPLRFCFDDGVVAASVAGARRTRKEEKKAEEEREIKGV